MTSFRRMPGIVSVEVYDCRSLEKSRFDIMQRLGINISFNVDSEPLALMEPGECEISTENGVSKTALRFRSWGRIAQGFAPGFLITDAQGERYALGCNSHPFPVVSCSESFGQDDGDPAGFSYEVTHVAVETPIRMSD